MNRASQMGIHGNQMEYIGFGSHLQKKSDGIEENVEF